MSICIKIIAILLLGPIASAASIDDFLNQVKTGSINYQIISLESSATQFSDELELSKFDLSGTLKAEYYDSKEFPNTPFSPATLNTKTYSLGLNKKWAYGFETGLAYELKDSIITFQGPADIDFFAPDISFKLKSNIVQDLIYGQSRSVNQKIENKSAASELAGKLQKKTILVNSLLSLVQLLEKREEVKLQKNLCLQIASQARKLRQKSKVGSVPKREYLLSLKNRNDCNSSERSLVNEVNSSLIILESDYGLKKSYVESIDLNDVFKEIVDLYKNKVPLKADVNLADRDSMQLIKKQLQATQAESNEIKASSKLPLAFELSLGLRGRDGDVSESHDGLVDTTNPYVLGTLQLDLPFKNREARSKVKINKWNQEILKRKIALEETSARSNFNLLASNIIVNLENYDTRLQNVSLSKSVLREAQRDFNIGRIDFLTLSEFQKSLIESQKQLSLVRVATTMRILNYLDYYQFFNRYLN